LKQGGLELETTPDPQPYRIELADTVEWLAGLGPRSVDLIVTDPAYESLEKHRATGTTTRLKQSKASSNEWFPIFPNSRFRDFFMACWKALKTNAHLYVYCDPETLLVITPIAAECGFKLWKPLVWDKVQIGMGYHYRARYEFIAFFEKGHRNVNDLSIPDIITHKRVRNGYPTEKPVEVSQVLIEQSSEPGELVVDPFMGSGSTGVASILSGRRFRGCDISQASLDYAGPRLEGAVQGLAG
jgi:site-specific DNA-methyltransferase (adenine-specific)